MANGYPPPDEPETPQDMPDEPDAPADNGGEPAKMSQAEANYREGNPQRSCGLCQYFTGSDGEGPYRCTKVDGEISPYGYSDVYARQDNPFRTGEREGFQGGTKIALVAAPAAPMLGGPNQPGGGTMTAAASPPPQISNARVGQTAVMSPPAVRIGGKMYGG